MRFLILAEGKLRERGLRETADDYLNRIRRRARCDELEAKNTEALRRCIPAESVVVVLDVRGRSVTSRAFAALLSEWTERGKGVVTFVIGGASGLPADVVAGAHDRLSLSTMTLPHRLARILLLEQLYRALTIQRGEPYAREQ